MSMGANFLSAVHIFNACGQAITGLSVNGHSAGNILGWSFDSQSCYTPNKLKVARVLHADSTNDAAFGVGTNQVIIPREETTGSVTIVIPTEIPLPEDLILYLTIDKAVLQSIHGNILTEMNIIASRPDILN